MTPINFGVAQSLAQARLDQIASEAGVAIELILSSTKEVEQGWVFFYNSSEFVRTGDPSWRLAGNGPLLVTRSGAVRVLPSHLPWEESILGATLE